jgi:membrane protease YdiL (CAAX protease family)
MNDGQNPGATRPRSLQQLLHAPLRFESHPHTDSRAEDGPVIVPPSHPMVPILPEGEAILQPPMDNTPDDPPTVEIPTRIPNLGHALLFLAITGAVLMIAQVFFLAFFQPHNRAQALQAAVSPKLLIGSEAVTYIATLIISWYFFRLIPIGITLSFVVQAVSSLITMPKDIPMDDFFHAPSDVWLITAFGVLLAPLFEEVAFRGFLLPAFAIAYDWLSLPRIPAAREQWTSTNAISRNAYIFSAVLTSILFAMLHGKQTAFTWPVLLLLFCVSLILTAVRIRLRSVLASTLVHSSYNFAVFFSAFIATGGYRHLDKLSH